MDAKETHAAGSQVTIFVCVSCSRAPDGAATMTPGKDLVAALERRFADAAAEGVTVAAVECLAVCKRPCTVAMEAPAKWTYVVGDIDPALHADDVVAAVLAYQRSENGIVAWRERPEAFRKGVVARVPPLGFVQPQAETA